MNPRPSIRKRNGFTLVEVLMSLGLCLLLTITTASAVAFAARAERLASRDGEASLLLLASYAAQRLRPDLAPAPPPDWRIDQSSDLIPGPDDILREWHRLAIADRLNEIPPFTLRILDDSP